MSPSSPIHAAIQSNLVLLHQGTALLAALGEERYTQKLALCFNASIGGHVRHVIEHYQSFFRGLDDADIDYERRARDPLIESDSIYATNHLEAIAQRLDELGGLANRGLLYCVETAPGIATATSLLRELEFLLNHTVHHYALIAIMARLQDVKPEPTFGIAPSTLRYQRAQTSCAR
jgi:uncharacterized damage-inducible protein DinB